MLNLFQHLIKSILNHVQDHETLKQVQDDRKKTFARASPDKLFIKRLATWITVWKVIDESFALIEFLKPDVVKFKWKRC
jgi:hypothetical protein